MIKVDEDNTITIIRGDSGYVKVPLVEVKIDEDTGEEIETPYELKEGEVLRFAAAKKFGATEEECFIIREIPHDTMRLYFEPEDTKSQKFGSYKYDLEFTNEDGFVDTILRGALVISEEVY